MKIVRAVFVKGKGGAQEPGFSTEFQDVLAKVQLISAETVVENQRRHQPAQVKVYFAEQKLLTGNHRIIGPDKTVYKVMGWSDPDRIDSLFVVDCEVTAWPQS